MPHTAADSLILLRALYCSALHVRLGSCGRSGPIGRKDCNSTRQSEQKAKLSGRAPEAIRILAHYSLWWYLDRSGAALSFGLLINDSPFRSRARNAPDTYTRAMYYALLCPGSRQCIYALSLERFSPFFPIRIPNNLLELTRKRLLLLLALQACLYL